MLYIWAITFATAKIECSLEIRVTFILLAEVHINNVHMCFHWLLNFKKLISMAEGLLFICFIDVQRGGGQSILLHVEQGISHPICMPAFDGF